MKTSHLPPGWKPISHTPPRAHCSGSARSRFPAGSSNSRSNPLPAASLESKPVFDRTENRGNWRMRSFLKFLFIKSTLVHASGHWYCLHLNLVTWGNRLRNEELRDPGAWGAMRGNPADLGHQGYRCSLWHTACKSYALVLGPLW